MEDWNKNAIDLSTKSVPKKCRKREHTLFSITLSIIFLVTAVTVIAGMSTWGLMYGLNASGYDFMSKEIQVVLTTSMKQTLSQYFALPAINVQEVEELMRLELQTNLIQDKTDLNSTLRILWTKNKQSQQSVFVGAYDGTFFGYIEVPLNGSLFNRSVLSISEGFAQNLTTFRFSSDYYGYPMELLVTTVYNCTDRSWYQRAIIEGGYSVSKPYVFFTTREIGITVSIPLFRDLQPPKFNPEEPIRVRPNGPIDEPRDVIGVVGSDLTLTAISTFMSELPLRGGTAWIFDGYGAFMIGSSNLSVSMIADDGSQLRTDQVNGVVINETMKFILENNDPVVDAGDYDNYYQIERFFNRFLEINGVEYIVSVDVLVSQFDAKWYFVIITEKDIFYGQAVYSNVVSLLVLFLCVMPVIAAFSAVFGHFCFSIPTIRLARLMRRIAGNLELDSLPVEDHKSKIREIRDMENNFDSMRSALQGFEKFAPTHIVRKLLSEKIAATLGVEEVMATSFFSDIVGFTSISEKVSPTELIECLEEYFNEMTKIIHNRKGVIGDFIGDAVFAFWNTPEKTTQHAYLACDAAIEQQRVLSDLRMGWRKRGLPEFFVRMGVHTGKVLAGNVGSDSRMKYTLIGDNVNLASRLEGLGKFYGVYLIVSAETYEQFGVRDNFVCRVLDVVKVVGKDSTTTILTLLGRRGQCNPVDMQLEGMSWEMIEAYQAKDFVLCHSLLRKMNVLKPNESSIQLLLERVCGYLKYGVCEDWDGSVKMTEK